MLFAVVVLLSPAVLFAVVLLSPAVLFAVVVLLSPAVLFAVVVLCTQVVFSSPAVLFAVLVLFLPRPRPSPVARISLDESAPQHLTEPSSRMAQHTSSPHRTFVALCPRGTRGMSSPMSGSETPSTARVRDSAVGREPETPRAFPLPQHLTLPPSFSNTQHTFVPQDTDLALRRDPSDAVPSATYGTFRPSCPSALMIFGSVASCPILPMHLTSPSFTTAQIVSTLQAMDRTMGCGFPKYTGRRLSASSSGSSPTASSRSIPSLVSGLSPQHTTSSRFVMAQV